MSTFKAVYTTMLRSIDDKIEDRRKLLTFLRSFKIPFVEGISDLNEGCVVLAEKYRPVINIYNEHLLVITAQEEKFKADINAALMVASNLPDMPSAPPAGLPPAQAMTDPSAKYGPEMKSLKSSNVDSFGYTHTTQTLRVKFTNGDVYDYEGVPHEIAQGLETAQSPGGFLNAHVKGSFKYKKL